MNHEGIFYVVLGTIVFFGTIFTLYQAIRILLDPKYAWEYQKKIMRQKGFDTSIMKPNSDWNRSITCRTAFTIPILFIGFFAAFGFCGHGIQLLRFIP